METKYFWLQQKENNQELTIEKIRGTVNPADLLTEHLEGKRLMMLCDLLKIKHIGSRSSSAQKLTSEQVPNSRLSCISSQSHRFTLTMTHYFNATRAKHQRFFSFSLVLLFSSRLRDSGVVWNLCLRQVILALIRIPHVYCGVDEHLVSKDTRQKRKILKRVHSFPGGLSFSSMKFFCFHKLVE